MIDWPWIRAAKDALLMIALSAVALYVLLILYTRLVGLRSFLKMSGFDFAIAIGPILAGVTLWQKPMRHEQVRAVVMESTGDVSVLHAPPEAPAIDDALLTDVDEEPK